MILPRPTLHRSVIALLIVAAFTSLTATARADNPPRQTDVLVYGATPAGIAAALAAADGDHAVILIEPTARIGGLVTNGLSHTDFRTFEGLTGAYLRFAQRIQRYYVETYGEDSPQAKGNFRGTHAEPKVNLLVFQQMLGERKNVAVLTQHRLDDVHVRKTTAGSRLAAARFTDSHQKTHTIEAKVFIDATYEGDLMAAAGVEYRIGREGRGEYDEPLAPQQADKQVQGYNFRLVMTREPNNRVTPKAPPGYDREDFVDVLPLLESDRIETVFCRWRGGMYKAQLPALPNGKLDINDVSHAPVRLSLPSINDAWPDGDAETRRRIFDEHVRHNVGLFYFLQNDEAVPAKFRDEARQWGFCKDEFVENDHLPLQLYVREARRMVGAYVFTEHDTNHAENDARAVLRPDAIAMGDYGPNCHGTAHEGPRFGGKHTGEFYKRVPPYQIPYGVLVPKRCDNLLVPVACSASHVGFCALRLEPIWMSLGEAAGTAANVAVDEAVRVQQVSVAKVQRMLHANGAATIYVSDVLPGHADFAAVQWWATAGGLHNLAPKPEKDGQRGEHITGQYFKAFPNHDAQLDRALDDELRKQWMKLSQELGVAKRKIGKAATRGEFIRAAFAAREAR